MLNNPKFHCLCLRLRILLTIPNRECTLRVLTSHNDILLTVVATNFPTESASPTSDPPPNPHILRRSPCARQATDATDARSISASGPQTLGTHHPSRQRPYVRLSNHDVHTQIHVKGGFGK